MVHKHIASHVRAPARLTLAAGAMPRDRAMPHVDGNVWRLCSPVSRPERSPQTKSSCVKRIPPDTANHEQNGYEKVYDDKYTFKTNVDNDKSDTTHTDMRNMQN